MNILIIHNYYSIQGGEESVVDFQKKLLEEKGHKVELYTRNYHEMKDWKFGKIGGMFTSVYNKKSFDDLETILDQFMPEVAILHNLYPIISPAIIPFLKEKGVRVYQVVHNYRLFCPIGIFYNKHRICHKCLHAGREWNCLIHNCNKSFLGSFSFALRAFLVRKLNYFKQVSKFLVLSDFQKQMILKSDLGTIPIEIIPNSISVKKQLSLEEVDLKTKQNIGFVGRLTKEKGFEDFIEIAKKMPQYSFCVAGDYSKLDSKIKIPKNLHFEGVLTHEELSDFYQKCRVILFLSHWYEGFPMVLLESMHYYTPLIVTNLGVMPEVIQHNVNGYVVKAGDLESIQKHVEMIFDDDTQYIEFIKNGKQRAEEFYSTERYYERLMLAITEGNNEK